MSQPWTAPPPPGVYGQTPGNNLVIGIIATVVSVSFCCIPHGLISLLYATQVNKKAAMGDLPGAINAAKQAKMWGLISIIVALIGLAAWFFFGVFSVILSSI